MGEITVPSDGAYDPASHLSFRDVAIGNPSEPTMVQIHLRQSKTDQFRQGVDVFVGRTWDDLCPVAAVLAYLAVRGASPGPLFRFRDGRYLTRERFVARVRQALDTLGLDSRQYAGHSFRIGAATTAASCGIEDSVIKTLGRWHSSAFLTYIRTPRNQLASISRRLSNTSTAQRSLQD